MKSFIVLKIIKKLNLNAIEPKVIKKWKKK